MTVIGIGIVGAGLQGQRRAQALEHLRDTRLVLVADVVMSRARDLSITAGCNATDDWHDVIDNEDIDLVIVCTPNSSHAEISIAAMKAGKHVLCEKPLARTVEEAQDMVNIARQSGVSLKCGFNLRHHPAVKQALKWKRDGLIGRPMFIRSVYGICGRTGYTSDWRMRIDTAGGGQLMDQGMHVLDLCRIFAGNFAEVRGLVATTFWDIPVEDNAFALMKSKDGTIASFHVSWTLWKNTFSFEIFGTEGAAVVNGLGGSYGDESVALVKKPKASEPFSERHLEFRGLDKSWEVELAEMISSLNDKNAARDDGSDGLEALRLAHAIYTSAKTGQTVKLNLHDSSAERK